MRMLWPVDAAHPPPQRINLIQAAPDQLPHCFSLPFSLQKGLHSQEIRSDYNYTAVSFSESHGDAE